MSIYIMIPVFETHKLTSSEKLVALSLADNARDDGGSVYPGISTTAGKTALSERTVQRVIRSLVAKGVLAVEKEATHNFPTVYRFLLTPDRKSLAIDSPGGVMVSPVGVTLTTERGDIDDVEGCHSVTQTVNKPLEEPSHVFSGTKRKNKKIDYDESYSEVWSIYPRRDNKAGGYRSYCATLKRGADRKELLLATENYARERSGQEPRYTLQAQTFFGPNERWRDFLPSKESEVVMSEGQKKVAKIYDDFDLSGMWESVSGEIFTTHPSASGIERPLNHEGFAVDQNGRAYTIDNLGKRRYNG